MSPANLRRHLQTKHKDFPTKYKQFSNLKVDKLEQSKHIIHKTAVRINYEKVVIASYQLYLHVAKIGEPHIIAKGLSLSAT